MSYGTGYKKPPKDKQFKKGNSGNPKGRPKGTSNFLVLLEKELGTPMTITENGKKRSTTRLGVMVKRLVNGALQGDYKALIALLEILRKNGRMDTTGAEQIFVEDYQSILDDYVAKRTKKSKSAAKDDAAENGESK